MLPDNQSGIWFTAQYAERRQCCRDGTGVVDVREGSGIGDVDVDSERVAELSKGNHHGIEWSRCLIDGFQG
jgi:hypothetical protein